MKTVGPANVNVKQGRLPPNGRKVAAPIYGIAGGVNDLWIIDTESNASRRLTSRRGHVDNPIWAPDSARLAFKRAYDLLPSSSCVASVRRSPTNNCRRTTFKW